MSLRHLWHQARWKLRERRRQTLVGPVLDAFSLRAVLRPIEARSRDARVLGPDELSPYVRLLTPLSPLGDLPDDLSFDFFVIRQDQLGALDARLLATLRASSTCLLENRRFALFAPASSTSPHTWGSRNDYPVERRIDVLLDPGPAPLERAVRPASASDRGMVVTTFNRPNALRRSLPQVAALGHALVVVDDGSSSRLAEANAAICRDCGADYLRFPENRGLCVAMNVGLSYMMADRRVQWISYFQDDVDVDPLLMDRLRAVEDETRRPIVTGYDADEHPSSHEEDIGGIRVKMKQTSPAVHLHAHRQYWRGVMPIPTQYLGAPKRRWEASLEDHWIVGDAPGAAGARGLLVPCLPGLVRTFVWHPSDSTWGNPNMPDPPLGSQGGEPGR